MSELDTIVRLNAIWHTQSLVIYRMLLIRLRVRKRNAN